MNELRLMFSPSKDGSYTASFENNWHGHPGSPVAFVPFLEEDDYENLRWYLEDFMDLPDGGAVIRAQGVEAQLREWGHRLHDAIFTAGANQSLLAQLLAHQEPRILTIGTSDARLLRLPWELISDAAGSLANRVSIRRQLEKPETAVERKVVLPLRILYIVSRPGDTGFIDPRLTTRSVFDALDPLGASVQVDFCRPPTLARMEEMLRAAEHAQDPYDLVHFDGHGTFIAQIQLGALCFEQPGDGAGQARTDLVRADRLGNLLAAHKIPLVILEACRSATVGQTAVFRSVAPRLIQAGVNSVLSMGHAVHVEAARILLDRFYREAVRGTSIGHAVAQARAALIAAPNRWIEYGPQGRTVALKDWFLPHLYQRGLDEPLVPPQRAQAAATQPRLFDVFLSHNHADSARVRRLAIELSNRHGLRVWLDDWQKRIGPLEDLCAEGIRDSRYTVVVGSLAAMNSGWVRWEIAQSRERDPSDQTLLPLKFEEVKLSDDLARLYWVDFKDPANDEAKSREIAGLIRSADARLARQLRGFRGPPTHKDEVGTFPPKPMYGFQGRARELHDLERRFRAHRGIVLHAMGGMGKTTLATEAAHWWTRSGLFRDGACFISFEQFASAERVVQILGTYLEGPNFEALPATEQHRRALELFDQKDVLVVWDNFESVLSQFNDPQGSQRQEAQASTPEKGQSLLTSAATGPYTPDERGRLNELFRELTALPAGRGRLLVTCRPGETGLPGAQRTELQGLARPDSLWLLSRVLAKDNLTLDDARLAKDKLGSLLDVLADHPLSIELVGPHLKELMPEQIIADFGKLIVEFKRDNSDVERNSSLLASLAFSTRRLSAAAQAALPWLALFSGGVFEQVLLDVSQLDPQQWEAVRGELEGTALIRVESDIQIGDRPYLRFHPTLEYAGAGRSAGFSPLQTPQSEEARNEPNVSSPATLERPEGRAPDMGEVRKRFVQVYDVVDTAVRQALGGSNSRGGLEVLAREETNFRTAVRWAAGDQDYAMASAMGDTFCTYLERSGRLRERDAWVKWLAGEVRKGGFSEALADSELDEAWMLFNQGRGPEAIDRLKSLRERLRATKEFNPVFKLAATQAQLGRILFASGLSGQAVPVLEEAVTQWEALVEARSGFRPTAANISAGVPDDAGKKAYARLGNLSAALGDLANALGSAGQLDKALIVAERGLEIDQALGRDREVAVDHGRCAQMLMAQGRHAEADARYEEALAAARRAGDKELEGATLQHQGSLADDLGEFDRAASLYQRVLKLFQEMNNDKGVMLTCNLLGVVERKQGRLSEARTWYERSREIAKHLEAAPELAQAAQNIGIVCQLEGEAARQQGQETQARQRFEEAKRFINESLKFEQQHVNEPAAAQSFSQLAQVHLLLDELDEAERQAHQAREIRERLGLKEVHITYHILARISLALGNAAQAEEWERKRDAVRAELKRRARGPGASGGLPPQFMKGIQALAMACAQAGAERIELDPQVEGALSQIEQLPAPLSELAAFLRRLAAGELPPVPAGLPEPLPDFLGQLLNALREGNG